MKITAEQIIEELVDGLAMGDLGESVESFHFTRVGPGVLRLDYGDAGQFTLTVEDEPSLK
jgi:hypothetical protein